MAEQTRAGEARRPGAGPVAEHSRCRGQGEAWPEPGLRGRSELSSGWIWTGQADFPAGTVPGSEPAASAQAQPTTCLGSMQQSAGSRTANPWGSATSHAGERDGDDRGWRAAEELRGCRGMQPPSASAPKCWQCPARCRQRWSPRRSVPPT